MAAARAERIAASVDPARFGVKAIYVIGSAKERHVGAGQRPRPARARWRIGRAARALEEWLEGWSLALAEMNYLRTGYRTGGAARRSLRDGTGFARGSSYAVKVGAVTDAARPLPIGAATGRTPARPD